MKLVNAYVDGCAALVLLVLIFAIINEIKYKELGAKAFLVCLFCLLFGVSFDLPIYLLEGRLGNMLLIEILYILSYISIETGVVFFTQYMVVYLNQKLYVSTGVVKFVAAWSYFCCLIYGIMVGYGNAFAFDIYGNYGFSNEYYITQILPMVALLMDAFIVLSCRRSLTRKNLFTWLLFILLPVFSMAIGIFVKGAFFNFMISISTLLIFINIHTEQNVKIAAKDAEITESRMKVMVSQIQPHFMYNTLNSIYYLIEKDPEKAQSTLSTFSDYLRSNINALGADKPIDFGLELKHIKAYLELEKVRFEEELEIEYDIKDINFKVPSLSIQTLVENAIKHGLSQKDGKGTISISTYEDKNYHNILIKDDGVGMNTKDLDKHNNVTSSGIGIKTSKERIKLQCSGTVEIYSILGKGTDVVIKIPKEIKQL